MWAWGSGEMGQLGTGKPENSNVPRESEMTKVKIDIVACGMYHTLALTEDQVLYGTGANKNGQLGFLDMSNRYQLELVPSFENEPV
mmetsp:Transcript_15367/g.13105  ORF Transcript_15367/g.13105 Transcript_15367/m.13105 type:complete len:86 (-) Transcript_15367:201-458(-)